MWSGEMNDAPRSHGPELPELPAATGHGGHTVDRGPALQQSLNYSWTTVMP